LSLEEKYGGPDGTFDQQYLSTPSCPAELVTLSRLDMTRYEVVFLVDVHTVESLEGQYDVLIFSHSTVVKSRPRAGSCRDRH
jgi:hypothetical protein